MNQNEETLYEETVNETPQNEPEAPIENEKQPVKKSDADFLKRAAMLGAAIFAGGTVGGGIAYSHSPAEEPAAQQEGTEQEPQQEPEHADSHARPAAAHHDPTPEPTGGEPTEPASDVFVINDEAQIEMDGEQVIAARVTHNGHEAFMIDRNQDGHYDYLLEDTNGDGTFSSAEIHDISDMQIEVHDQNLLAEGGDMEGDPGIPEIVVGEEGLMDIEGNPVIAARATVGDQNAILLDLNSDGTYDEAIIDANNNGQLDEGDVRVNIVSAGIEVQDESLIDLAQSQIEPGEDGPDYINTVGGDPTEDGSEVELIVEEQGEPTEGAEEVVVEVEENDLAEAEDSGVEEEIVIDDDASEDMAMVNIEPEEDVVEDEIVEDEVEDDVADMAEDDVTEDDINDMHDSYDTV